MGKGLSIIGIGVIIFIFGLIFDLQGQSIVGPESSFMYANPDWITYGIQIMIGGIIIIGIGSVLKILKKWCYQNPAAIGLAGFIISLNKIVAKEPRDNENSILFLSEK